MSKSSGVRPSFAHLADKFNTSAPTNYVAGRGRGISGFSKPEPEDLPKRGGAAASSSSFAVLESDATDTRALDVDETERFENQELSMDNAQAGGAIEAFSMEAERREGEPFVLDQHTLLVGPTGSLALARLHADLAAVLGVALGAHSDPRFRPRQRCGRLVFRHPKR